MHVFAFAHEGGVSSRVFGGDELHLLPALDLVRRAAVAEVAGRPALAALLVVEPPTRCLLDRTQPQNQRRALGSHLVRAT